MYFAYGGECERVCAARVVQIGEFHILYSTQRVIGTRFIDALSYSKSMSIAVIWSTFFSRPLLVHHLLVSVLFLVVVGSH